MVAKQKYIVYNLRETYHELGQYEFKIVLSPKHFKNGHLSELDLVDSDGKKMKAEVKKWGRKISCMFTIDNSVSDGVSYIKMILRDDSGYMQEGRASFWVIKP